MANKFQGFRATEKHLEVCWSGERGTALRFETLRIPWAELVTDQDLMDRLNIAVAKNLRDTWAMDDGEHPLF